MTGSERRGSRLRDKTGRNATAFTTIGHFPSERQGFPVLPRGPSRQWGSGRHGQGGGISFEQLSEPGAELAVDDRAADLKQEIGATVGPAYLPLPDPQLVKLPTGHALIDTPPRKSWRTLPARSLDNRCAAPRRDPRTPRHRQGPALPLPGSAPSDRAIYKQAQGVNGADEP